MSIVNTRDVLQGDVLRLPGYTFGRAAKTAFGYVRDVSYRGDRDKSVASFRLVEILPITGPADRNEGIYGIQDAKQVGLPFHEQGYVLTKKVITHGTGRMQMGTAQDETAEMIGTFRNTRESNSLNEALNLRLPVDISNWRFDQLRQTTAVPENKTPAPADTKDDVVVETNRVKKQKKQYTPVQGSDLDLASSVEILRLDLILAATFRDPPPGLKPMNSLREVWLLSTQQPEKFAQYIESMSTHKPDITLQEAFDNGLSLDDTAAVAFSKPKKGTAPIQSLKAAYALVTTRGLGARKMNNFQHMHHVSRRANVRDRVKEAFQKFGSMKPSVNTPEAATQHVKKAWYRFMGDVASGLTAEPNGPYENRARKANLVEASKKRRGRAPKLQNGQ